MPNLLEVRCGRTEEGVSERACVPEAACGHSDLQGRRLRAVGTHQTVAVEHFARH